MVSACVDGRVANTSNASEAWVGWETKYGDMCGDFSLLAELTVAEVKQIGYLLLPSRFINKTPIDGLCGMTDEEGLGVSYCAIDAAVRGVGWRNESDKARIMQLHKNSRHKHEKMPTFTPYKEMW